MIFVQKVTAITKVHSLLETLLLIYYLTWFICIFWGIIFSLVNASKNRLKVRHADWSIFTTRKRSLGQGNIFAPVCHSVHRGVCLSAFWDTTSPRSRHPPGTRYPPEQTPPPPADPPMQCMLGDTVNKRVVCILLQCNLVGSLFALTQCVVSFLWLNEFLFSFRFWPK